MRPLMIVFMMLFLLGQLLCSSPIAMSDNGEVEWSEHLTINGTVESTNVYASFQVNSTVVEIDITLSWVSASGDADLDMEVRDKEGYVANTSATYQMPEIMTVREFPNRGQWRIVVVPASCGSCGSANFTAELMLRNIALPELEVTSMEIEAESSLELQVTTTYENISYYYYDFGDGSSSGWVNTSSWSKVYNQPGQYMPKARVMYADGTESEWVNAGWIEVTEESVGVTMVYTILLVIIVVIVTLLIVVLMVKKRQGG